MCSVDLCLSLVALFSGICLITGLANKKTVTVQPASGKEMAVVLSTTKTKKQNKPASLYHKSVMRKEFRKMAKAVKNQVWNNYICHCSPMMFCSHERCFFKNIYIIVGDLLEIVVIILIM